MGVIMAYRLKDKKEIDEYVLKIYQAAEHHARPVLGIIYPLSNTILNIFDISRDDIKVFQQKGEIRISCWVTINKKRCFFAYNHDTEKIELRNNTWRGEVLHLFGKGEVGFSIPLCGTSKSPKY